MPQVTQPGKCRLQHCNPGQALSGPSWVVWAALLFAFPDALLCISTVPQRKALVLGQSMSHNLIKFAVPLRSRDFARWGKPLSFRAFCSQGFASGPHPGACVHRASGIPRGQVCIHWGEGWGESASTNPQERQLHSMRDRNRRSLNAKSGEYKCTGSAEVPAAHW